MRYLELQDDATVTASICYDRYDTLHYTTLHYTTLRNVTYMLRFGKDFFTLGKGISGSFHSAHGTSRTAGKRSVGSKGSNGGGQGQGASKNELHGVLAEDTISTEESETVGEAFCSSS